MLTGAAGQGRPRLLAIGRYREAPVIAAAVGLGDHYVLAGPGGTDVPGRGDHGGGDHVHRHGPGAGASDRDIEVVPAVPGRPGRQRGRAAARPAAAPATATAGGGDGAAGLRRDHAGAQVVAGQHLRDLRDRGERVGGPLVHEDDLAIGELGVGLDDLGDAGAVPVLGVDVPDD